ncbi:VOC family protein [Minwuia sp.]|uniref:VOC family protein n=1 Tax=Minwuia sp. TaxID=2493630 RepID=UPI003A8F3015
MPLECIYAQLNCADIDRSVKWFEVLFGREPDASPMTGLMEWYHQGGAGFQLFANASDAGHGCMTLIISDLETERRRLDMAGLEPGEIRRGDIASVVQLSDPDGNTVVLAEPVK